MGNVIVLSTVCALTIVVLVDVVAVAVSNANFLVLSVLSINDTVLHSNDLLDKLSTVALPTRVSVLVGKVNVPVLTMVAMTGAVSVLFVSVCVVPMPTSVVVSSGNVIVLLVVCDVRRVVDVAVVPPTSKSNSIVLSVLSAMDVVLSMSVLLVSVSAVSLPTKVSGPVGKVSVPPLLIDVIMGSVSVLLVRVCVVPVPTRVVVSSGNVIVLLAVCDVRRVVDVAVVPATLKSNSIVLSALSAIDVVLSMSVLLVSVAAVAQPTKVSVLVGKVNVPVLTMVAMTGAVSVLLVSVSVVSLPTNVSVASGNVSVLLAVCVVRRVVVVPVVAPDVS